ncbi:MAG: sigma 54-interacting transcriptional regulator [Smithellaceae bacterium]|jgi:two-component system response regulator HydG
MVLHEQSRRRGGPFVAISCAALPEKLLESELFGHIRGTFTELLDEIGDFPLNPQPKLLRALAESSISPIGGDRKIFFDVRVVATTNRDLESAIEEDWSREGFFSY